MDKKFVQLDNKRIGLLIFNIVSLGVLISMCIVFLFANVLPVEFLNVFFWVFVSSMFAYLIILLILVIIYKKSYSIAIKSKYDFDRNLDKEDIKTEFKDCILQEVVFQEDGFNFNGGIVNYNDVNVEYSIYGDNIMMHIYLKELEDTNPLLIFIVNEDLYFCIKKFKINLDLLDKEINLFNMNYRK